MSHLLSEIGGYKAFDSEPTKLLVTQTIKKDVRSFRSFRDCFTNICDTLADNRIEIPLFEILSAQIDDAYKREEKELLTIVERNVPPTVNSLLDGLFELSSSDQSKSYRLALLKRFSQKLTRSNIKRNVETFSVLDELFVHLKPTFEMLPITVEGVKYYANYVEKSQIFQVKRKNTENRNLHLIAFIMHQYFRLQDLFVETFIACVTNTLNTAEKMAKEAFYRGRHEQAEKTLEIVNSAKDLEKAMQSLAITLQNNDLTDTEKVEKALQTIKRFTKNDTNEKITKAEDDIQKMSGEALYFQCLQDQSMKLQGLLNQVLLSLRFSENSTNTKLLKAIAEFKRKSGRIDESFPINFLTKKELKYVDVKDGMKLPLLKVLLFKHIVEEIKAGALSVKYSYQYKSLDEYLIEKTAFYEKPSDFLDPAKINEYLNFSQYIKSISNKLHAQFCETNEHAQTDQNKDIKLDGAGGFKMTAYRKPIAEDINLQFGNIELFPEDERVTLTEMLHTVHKATNCLNELQYNSLSRAQSRPEDRVLIAAIISAGCHFSPYQFSKLSKDISSSMLVTAQNQYLTLTNCRQASDSVMRYVQRMPLSSIYIQGDELPTSSDGQKYIVSKESVYAKKSFKYGGKDAVVSNYSFIDSRNLFFHSEVISGSSREAHYMLDGVLKNDVVKSTLHTTDSHGFTEVVMGLSYLLKITFVPRLKGIHNFRIFSDRGTKTYSHKNYPILPKGKLDMSLIESEWMEILRVVASIVLGYSTVSQILKRLNSYSEYNNPLYRALREFGRMIKSMFILRYIDDLELRQTIQKQLNKGESGNKLDRALAVGRAEYAYATKEEQESVESCKRLLKNVIVCWNYMYLTNKMHMAENDDEKIAIAQKIRESSTVAWHHVLMHGEFDFSDQSLMDTHEFALNKMQDPNLFKFL